VRTSSALFSLALFALTTLPPAAARAQAAPPPLSQALHGEGKQAYDSAKLLAENNDFGGALEEFSHAYRLSKDPRLLYNMAICEKGLHHYARMKAVLEQYLREGGAAVDADSRAVAQQALTAIKSLVASLRVNANEGGAEVLVDGRTVGKTPLAAPVSVDLGPHKVTVQKEGFDTAEQSVDAAGGTEVPVSFSLTASRHTAQLMVTADAAAAIVLDGSNLAQGRFDGSVAPGPHHVTVSERGKQTFRADLDLREGETRQLQVTLEDEGHGSSPWPWIAGGVAVAAGLAVGGYFLFRPQPQTTTPVPPGNIGSVQFMWGR
jgi:hypothetical protein